MRLALDRDRIPAPSMQERSIRVRQPVVTRSPRSGRFSAGRRGSRRLAALVPPGQQTNHRRRRRPERRPRPRRRLSGTTSQLATAVGSTAPNSRTRRSPRRRARIALRSSIADADRPRRSTHEVDLVVGQYASSPLRDVADPDAVERGRRSEEMLEQRCRGRLSAARSSTGEARDRLSNPRITRGAGDDARRSCSGARGAGQVGDDRRLGGIRSTWFVDGGVRLSPQSRRSATASNIPSAAHEDQLERDA